MAQRRKRPKMIFKKFLQAHKGLLEKNTNGRDNSGKFKRDPWMLKSRPDKEPTVEALVESDQQES